MSNQVSIDEQLSALADGELERGSARFLLRRLENDGDLAKRFERYHVVRACLRREYKSHDADAFCAGIMAAIDADAFKDSQPVGDRLHGAPVTPWLKRALGGAIAAGVAGLALFASMRPPVADAPASSPVATLTQPHAAPGLTPNLIPQQVAGRSSIVLPQSGAVDPRIEAYLVRHSGAVATLGHSGAMPYAYAVGLRTRPQTEEQSDPNVHQAAAVGAQGQ